MLRTIRLRVSRPDQRDGAEDVAHPYHTFIRRWIRRLALNPRSSLLQGLEDALERAARILDALDPPPHSRDAEDPRPVLRLVSEQ